MGFVVWRPPGRRSSVDPAIMMGTFVRFFAVMILGAGLGFGVVFFLRHSDAGHRSPLRVEAKPLARGPVSTHEAFRSSPAPIPLNLADLPFGGKRLTWWKDELRALEERPDPDRRALLERRARANGLVVDRHGAMVEVRPAPSREACLTEGASR